MTNELIQTFHTIANIAALGLEPSYRQQLTGAEDHVKTCNELAAVTILRFHIAVQVT